MDCFLDLNVIPRYDKLSDCLNYPKFSNFGWEILYTNYKANMIRILDFEDHKDISRLCLLLKLDLSKNNLIDTLSELHSYNLRQPLSAIRCTNDLKELFPNADPIYLDIVGEVFSNNITGLNEFLDKVATNIISYPRITGYNEKLKTLKIIQSLTVNFNVKDFLKLCPDPVNYFKNLNRNIKKNHYIEESMSYLSYKFRNVSMEMLKNVFYYNEYNLSNTVEDLLTLNQNNLKYTRKLFEKPKPFNFKSSDNIDLVTEIAFIDNKDNILRYIQSEKNIRTRKFIEAKSSNQLQTCECCFNDELLSTEINFCQAGHTFCLSCIKKGVEIIVSEGKLNFKCFANCNEEFSLIMIKNVVDNKLYQHIIKMKQMQEIKAANIEGLETCAFCDYSVILSRNIKTIKCLNPECLKETCRECRGENHFPLKCNELEEKDPEVQVRIMIENKMSDVLIRTCYYCNCKFIKDAGCNQMKCTCGKNMCYICKKPVDSSYNHFYHNIVVENKCPLFVDENIVHTAAVEAAARLILKELKVKNPRLLRKIDITKILPEIKKTKTSKLVDTSSAEVIKLIALIIGQNEEDVKNLKDMRSMEPLEKKNKATN